MRAVAASVLEAQPAMAALVFCEFMSREEIVRWQRKLQKILSTKDAEEKPFGIVLAAPKKIGTFSFQLPFVALDLLTVDCE